MAWHAQRQTKQTNDGVDKPSVWRNPVRKVSAVRMTRGEYRWPPQVARGAAVLVQLEWHSEHPD
jgi:hypothetical protein